MTTDQYFYTIFLIHYGIIQAIRSQVSKVEYQEFLVMYMNFFPSINKLVVEKWCPMDVLNGIDDVVGSAAEVVLLYVGWNIFWWVSRDTSDGNTIII